MNLADERQRLLRAVLDAPDDDGPRSVYSDWLQQQGDPRGELIAVQLEIERLDAKTNGERVRQLFERQSALLLKHRRAWLKETFGKRSSECGFRRGFVHAVSLRVSEIVELGERIFETEPVHKIQVLDTDVASLTRAPVASKIRALDFTHVWLDEGQARDLFSAPSFQRLEQLDLVSCRLNAASMRVLSEAGVEERFPALRSLSLVDNELADDGACTLAEAPVLAGLRELHLGKNGIGPAGAMALARSPYLAQVEHLHLWGNPLGARGLSALRSFGGRLHADGHAPP